MRPASVPSAPLASPDYYEKLGRLQHGLRESEKKRLDLERKLYEYNQSDICRVKLKYVKLKKYLKDICESEKKAHIRNQEYLKHFEHIQTHIGHFTNTEKLQKLKIDYETKMKMQLLSNENLGIKVEVKGEDKDKQIASQVRINSGPALSRGLYQPATSFMGRQMSATSSTEDFSTQEKLFPPTKNFSISNPQSQRQTAPSSNVTDSYVVPTHSDTRCLKKSDKIDGKTSLQIGEKTPVIASVLSEEEQTHCLEIGSNHASGKSNLSEGKKSAKFHFPLWGRLSPENSTTDSKYDSSSRSEGSDKEILTWGHIKVEKEKARPPVSVISVTDYRVSENKCSQEKHSAREGFSDHLSHRDPVSQKPSRKMQEEQKEESLSSSSSSSSDLTVSISEDDLFLKSPEPQPNPGDKMEEEDGIEALKLIHSEQESDALLTEKRNCILQALSSSDSKKESSTNSPTRESKQATESALLATGLGHDVATLKVHGNSIKEDAPKPSGTFPEDLDQKAKATALLKKALTEECDDRSAIHSNESSCSLPSILNDNSRIKEAEPALWLNSVLTGEQEVSNSYTEESKEESLAAKIPITETKAYQLLKQATLQDSKKPADDQCQEDSAPSDPLSGLKVGSKTKTMNKIASEASFSSSNGNPLSRYQSKELPTNLKSKAFWGESDDSNSEIEAALRPRNHNIADDYDDFYD
ncbi:LOW QUALITY PROTEIN: centrosomal protein kizuna [Suncus etruscus]|uniref:LOW QUALITY PROTEIN: centrosomal protein kizuna n=1 Tax=Suncus etruscus TaxID=109475 RepID=UPI002110D62D|nr:LOW QUALITY PROTEIN: centrosomal protein kizuna [Suncus etruscus]